MLVLSRRLNERVMIGNDVVLTIVDISENQVKIGIDAPKNLQVHREEIYDRIRNGQGMSNAQAKNKSC